MNEGRLKNLIKSSIEHQLDNDQYVSYFHVLLDLDIIDEVSLEHWEKGNSAYLSKHCHTNEKKLLLIVKLYRSICNQAGYIELTKEVPQVLKHGNEQNKFQHIYVRKGSELL